MFYMYRLILLLIVICSFFVSSGCEQAQTDYSVDGIVTIERAFRNRESNFFVTSKGIVEQILPDDVKGTQHQRFIVRLKNDQTLLITYNIDVAPRIHDVHEGDEIRFRGEYEWNEKGGVIHWTHHDPLMKRAGGWIEHKGKRYQ